MHDEHKWQETRAMRELDEGPGHATESPPSKPERFWPTYRKHLAIHFAKVTVETLPIFYAAVTMSIGFAMLIVGIAICKRACGE